VSHEAVLEPGRMPLSFHPFPPDSLIGGIGYTGAWTEKDLRFLVNLSGETILTLWLVAEGEGTTILDAEARLSSRDSRVATVIRSYNPPLLLAPGVPTKIILVGELIPYERYAAYDARLRIYLKATSSVGLSVAYGGAETPSSIWLPGRASNPAFVPQHLFLLEGNRLRDVAPSYDVARRLPCVGCGPGQTGLVPLGSFAWQEPAYLPTDGFVDFYVRTNRDPAAIATVLGDGLQVRAVVDGIAATSTTPATVVTAVGEAIAFRAELSVPVPREDRRELGLELLLHGAASATADQIDFAVEYGSQSRPTGATLVRASDPVADAPTQEPAPKTNGPALVVVVGAIVVAAFSLRPGRRR
jgi:hypothetical protein